MQEVPLGKGHSVGTSWAQRSLKLTRRGDSRDCSLRDFPSRSDASESRGEREARRNRLPSVLRGRQHLIDDMDYAIARAEVARRDRRIVDHDAVARALDLRGLTVHGLGLGELADILARGPARRDVVLQDRDQLFPVLRLQPVVELARRQFRERGIGRREHREGTGTREHAAQISSRNRLAESIERALRGDRVDEIGLIGG